MSTELTDRDRILEALELLRSHDPDRRFAATDIVERYDPALYRVGIAEPYRELLDLDTRLRGDPEKLAQPIEIGPPELKPITRTRGDQLEMELYLGAEELIRVVKHAGGADGGQPVEVDGSHEVAWQDDADGYVPVKDAVKLAGERLSADALGGRIRRGAPIRHMRKGQRTKVHVNDLAAFLDTLVADSFEGMDDYMAGVEHRKAEERD